MTPGSYRKKGENQHVRYAISSSPLGRILVAATVRGLCAVAFADSDDELLAGLQSDLSRADLKRDDSALAGRLAAVLEQLRENPICTALPVDVRATAFQQRVWKALQQIPRGETRSYSEVACAIGQPTAVRAVARACGQNRLALVVPCHRVVGKNGDITGYRWGADRKKLLLAAEGKGGASLLK